MLNRIFTIMNSMHICVFFIIPLLFLLKGVRMRALSSEYLEQKT